MLFMQDKGLLFIVRQCQILVLGLEMPLIFQKTKSKGLAMEGVSSCAIVLYG